MGCFFLVDTNYISRQLSLLSTHNLLLSFQGPNYDYDKRNISMVIFFLNRHSVTVYSCVCFAFVSSLPILENLSEIVYSVLVLSINKSNTPLWVVFFWSIRTILVGNCLCYPRITYYSLFFVQIRMLGKFK
jgi:hypothetical protein